MSMMARTSNRIDGMFNSRLSVRKWLLVSSPVHLVASYAAAFVCLRRDLKNNKATTHRTWTEKRKKERAARLNELQRERNVRPQNCTRVLLLGGLNIPPAVRVYIRHGKKKEKENESGYIDVVRVYYAIYGLPSWHNWPITSTASSTNLFFLLFNLFIDWSRDTFLKNKRQAII